MNTAHYSVLNLIAPRVGWLTDLTNWLRELVRTIFLEAVEFAKDFLEFQLEMIVDVVLAIVNAVPVPQFLDGYTICGILSLAGPTVSWAVTTMRIPEGMLLISAGFVFYIIRKVVTLFQW